MGGLLFSDGEPQGTVCAAFCNPQGSPLERGSRTSFNLETLRAANRATTPRSWLGRRSIHSRRPRVGRDLGRTDWAAAFGNEKARRNGASRALSTWRDVPWETKEP